MFSEIEPLKWFKFSYRNNHLMLLEACFMWAIIKLDLTSSLTTSSIYVWMFSFWKYLESTN